MTLPADKLITINDRGARSATTFGSVEAGGGNMVFIKKLTASSSATLSFVNGASSVVLDSTYKEYLFTFKNIHPGTNDKLLQMNMSADTGSNYNVTKTTTFFHAYNMEDGTDGTQQYDANRDIAQSTGFATIAQGVNADNDQSLNGTLHLFNPSSTTFVKHFIARTLHTAGGGSRDCYAAGYGNTTSAVDAIQFKFDSGNIDAGDICLYGIL